MKKTEIDAKIKVFNDPKYCKYEISTCDFLYFSKKDADHNIPPWTCELFKETLKQSHKERPEKCLQCKKAYQKTKLTNNLTENIGLLGQ